MPGYPPLLQRPGFTGPGWEAGGIDGPNGCGKSTLLRTIAGQTPPLVGKLSLGASVQLGYMAQEQELLDSQSSAVDTLRQASPMNETEAAFLLALLSVQRG